MVTTTGIGNSGDRQAFASDMTGKPVPAGHTTANANLILLVCADFLVLWVCAALVLWVRVRLSFISAESLPGHIGFLLLLSVLVILFCHTQHLYSTLQGRTAWGSTVAITKAVSFSTILLSAFVYLTGQKAISRMAVGWTVLSSLFALTVWRYCRRKYLEISDKQGKVTKRHALIIGGASAAAALSRHLDDHRELGYAVRALIPAEGEWTDEAGSDQFHSTSSLSREELKRVIRGEFVDEVFIALPAKREQVMEVIASARELGCDVRLVPDLYDGLAWGAPVEYLGWLPTMQIQSKPAPVIALLAKRILDIVGSLVGLLVFAPLMSLIAVAIRVDSNGRIFYGSQRVGRKARHFTCYKFRTMVDKAEELRPALEHLNEREGVLFKIANDPRITPVGRFLRKYSLDELPQFWNVLKGDMSLVGPRPPVPGEYARYELDHLKRLDVVPGITGLWQVEARRNPSFESYVNLDSHYVDNWSLWLDFKILLKTFVVVAAGTGQ